MWYFRRTNSNLEAFQVYAGRFQLQIPIQLEVQSAFYCMLYWFLGGTYRFYFINDDKTYTKVYKVKACKGH